ncbi:MAG: hypothetical protein M0Q40_00220 [Limnochordia bacterium]|nr:hypothetical protein [Limnochordia bacterium]MDD4517951.1 BadF/BadG/BcrA/BcrD ATPase family protein [Limnochordia bacterium]
MDTVLAVDGGGTSTRCVLVNDQFGLLADETGPFCALVYDQKRSLAGLHTTIHRAMESAKAKWRSKCGEPMHITAACLGLSGVMSISSTEPVRHCVVSCLAKEGYRLSTQRLQIVSDVEIAHVAALRGESGIVLVVGTGAIAYGCNEAGDTARSDGWGWLLGDAGSGYAIGRDALRAVCAAADGRGASTRLTQALLSHFDVSDIKSLVRTVYDSNLNRTSVAELARIVSILASEGDQVADSILNRAGKDLSDTVLGVLRQLSFAGERVKVSWQGGVLKGTPRLVASVREHVVSTESGCVFVPPWAEPVQGALLLAQRSLKEPFTTV